MNIMTDGCLMQGNMFTADPAVNKERSGPHPGIYCIKLYFFYFKVPGELHYFSLFNDVKNKEMHAKNSCAVP